MGLEHISKYSKVVCTICLPKVVRCNSEQKLPKAESFFIMANRPVRLAYLFRCRTENGFATLVQADNPEPQMDDNMPSFFLAETLKYLYLLFSDDDILPLDQWVFNTEGHPLLITPGLAPKDAQ